MHDFEIKFKAITFEKLSTLLVYFITLQWFIELTHETVYYKFIGTAPRDHFAVIYDCCDAGLRTIFKNLRIFKVFGYIFFLFKRGVYKIHCGL